MFLYWIMCLFWAIFSALSNGDRFGHRPFSLMVYILIVTFLAPLHLAFKILTLRDDMIKK